MSDHIDTCLAYSAIDECQSKLALDCCDYSTVRVASYLLTKRPWALKWLNPQQDDQEIGHVMSVLKNSGCKSILEIGIGFGGTHMLFKQICEHVISVDNSLAVILVMAKALQRLGMETGSYLILGDSSNETTVVAVQRQFPGQIDALYIDGHHSPKQAIKDHETYAPLVKVGGCIFFHDWEAIGQTFDTGLKEQVTARIPEDYEFIRSGKGPGTAYYRKRHAVNA